MNNEDEELYQAALKRFKNQLRRAGDEIDRYDDREIVVFLEKDLRSTIERKRRKFGRVLPRESNGSCRGVGSRC